MLGCFKWLLGPGKPAWSPKPFKNETKLAKLQHLSPPLASRALPVRLTPARSSFPERGPGRPRTATLWRSAFPLGLALGGGEGRRAASRCSLLAPLPPPLWPPPLRPSEWGWGALRPPGGPPAAVPETRAGGGGHPHRLHRPPRASGRSALTSANFLAPLGGSERTRARAPGSPRPGWASRLLVGAPGHPPARRGPDGWALHCPPALSSKLMPRPNPLAITHDHHRGFYLSV